MKKNKTKGILGCILKTKVLIMMRLLVFFYFASTFSLIASGTYSQNKTITMNKENVLIKDVLSAIEDQSEYFFIYNNEFVDVYKRINVQAENKGITHVLDEIFSDQEVSYQINNRRIILKSSENSITTQQHIKLTGKVTDKAGQPLPGVTVVVKGTTNGTITNFDGVYTLADVSSNATVQFSFVGMKTQEIPVEGKTSINIVMEESAIGIEEVVAVGYGTMKKSDLTGAVSSVSSEILENKANTSLDQALQGRSAGVMISTGSGAPGGGMNIRIRGVSSYLNASEPLYVIDGVVVVNSEDYSLASYSSSPSAKSNPLANINPSDIESIEILKDASASSIYGARGSNGVILVSTKKGNSDGAPIINVDLSYGVQEIIKKLDLMTGPQLTGIVEEFRQRLGEEPLFDGSDSFHPLPNSAPTYDYQDLLFDVAPMYNANLSVRGGNNKTQYFISGSYLNQEGIMIQSKFDRYSFRVNLDSQVSKRLKIGTKTSYSITKNSKLPIDISEATNDILRTGLNYLPFLGVTNSEGEYIDDVVFASVPTANPVSTALEVMDNENSNRIMSTVYGELGIMQGLDLRVQGSYDGAFLRRDYFSSPDYYLTSTIGGVASVENKNITNLLFNGYLTYNKRFNDDLSISATAGYESQKFISQGSILGGQGFTNPGLGIWGMGTATLESRTINTFKSKKTLAAYFGRINLNYKNKYLFTLNTRADGSSVFSENNKWGAFSSGAFAWKLEEEQFIKDLNMFSMLKFRISYGSTGNGEIPLYQSQALWSINNNIPGYQSNGIKMPVFTGNAETNLENAAFLSRMANPDLKWEHTNQFDIGADMGFLNNRLLFTVDYYYKKTKDALIPRSIPKTSGFELAYMNMGELANEGLELSITGYPTVGKFKWNFNMNVSFMAQKPLSLADNEYVFVSGQGGRSNQLGLRMEVGKPAALLWGGVYNGIWNDQEEIDNRTIYNNGIVLGSYKGVDINGDNIFDSNDNTYIGRALPSMIFGFSNSFSYNGFELDMHIQGSYGNDVQINYWGNLIGVHIDNPTNALAEYYYDHWTPENTNAKYPGVNAAEGGTGTFNQFNSDNNVIFDASYVRLKTVTLAYNIPTKNLFFKNAKVYVSGQNLLTITNYPGFNPDISSLGQTAFNAGYDNSAYPIAKIFTIGANITF